MDQTHRAYGRSEHLKRMREDRKSTRLISSHEWISYAVFCLKKKIGNRNRLRDVLACVLAYEQAEWETFGLFAATLRLDEGETARIYLEAVAWATSSSVGANC